MSVEIGTVNVTELIPESEIIRELPGAKRRATVYVYASVERVEIVMDPSTMTPTQARTFAKLVERAADEADRMGKLTGGDFLALLKEAYESGVNIDILGIMINEMPEPRVMRTLIATHRTR
jgi:phytoene/squalene synthetase